MLCRRHQPAVANSARWLDVTRKMATFVCPAVQVENPFCCLSEPGHSLTRRRIFIGEREGSDPFCSVIFNRLREFSSNSTIARTILPSISEGSANGRLESLYPAEQSILDL